MNKPKRLKLTARHFLAPALALTFACALLLLSPESDPRRETAATGPSSRVEQVCGVIGLPAVRLTLRDEKKNRALIRALPKGPSPFATYLTDFYRRETTPHEPAPLLAVADEANQKYMAASPLKASSLKFSSAAARQANPQAYLAEFLKAAREASPRLGKSIDTYFSFRHPLLKESILRVEEKAELKELGGRYRTKDSGDGKTAIREITLSTDSGASFPNQFSTLFHELVHAENFEPHRQLDPGSPAFAEAELLDEAKAYDAQMGLYLELAQSNPEFYCNWLQVTSRYGNLVVPLGWLMASVEAELASGQFMALEAARLNFKDKTLLLGKDGGVKPELRARMQSLGLQFVR